MRFLFFILDNLLESTVLIVGLRYNPSYMYLSVIGFILIYFHLIGYMPFKSIQRFSPTLNNRFFPIYGKLRQK